MTRSTWRRIMAGAAIALAAAAVAQPAAAAEQSAITCPTGYLCLQPTYAPSNQVILVKEGASRTFPGGLSVNAVSNQTSVGYCVRSQPYNYGIAPKQEVVRAHTVLSVAPSRFCLT